jgi:hypothetical protein
MVRNRFQIRWTREYPITTPAANVRDELATIGREIQSQPNSRGTYNERICRLLDPKAGCHVEEMLRTLADSDSDLGALDNSVHSRSFNHGNQ